MSSHISSKPWERPTDPQMIQLHRGIEKKWIGKTDLQEFLTFVYLQANGKPTDRPTFGPQVSESTYRILWGAEKYFPNSVPEIAALLIPFEQLTSANFKFTRMVEGWIHDPEYRSKLKAWEIDHVEWERVASIHLNPHTRYPGTPAWKDESRYSEHLRSKPQEGAFGPVFEKMEELCDALSFLPGNYRSYFPVQIHTLGKDWKPQDESSPDKNNLWDFGQSIFAEEISARVKVDQNCLDNASSGVLGAMSTQIFNLLSADGAYRYNLVSYQDLRSISSSIINALARAVVLTAIQPNPRLAERLLKFVNFQLSGTPIINYKDGVVHVLSAPVPNYANPFELGHTMYKERTF